MSWKHLGVLPPRLSTVLVQPANRRLSGSTRWVTWTLSISVNSPIWLPPRPLMPATHTRIVSLAPSTRPEAWVPAIVNQVATPALAAALFLRNSRRVWRDMRALLGGKRVRGWGGVDECGSGPGKEQGGQT